MTVNVLCLWDGVGWRLRRQPTPSHYKDIVMICHSERSEESNIFYRTTMNTNKMELCKNNLAQLHFIFVPLGKNYLFTGSIPKVKPPFTRSINSGKTSVYSPTIPKSEKWKIDAFGL